MWVPRQRRRLRAALLHGMNAADALITQERLRNYSAIFVGLSIALLCFSTVQRLMAPQAFGPVTPDYLAHWTGGVLFLRGEGADLYDLEAQRTVQAEAVGPSSGLSWFVSPPLVAVLYAPLALLDYSWSALAWSLISMVLLGACLHSLRHLAPRVMLQRPWLVVLIVCASAATVELVGGGQDSAFVLAVWLAALRLIRSPHQVLAGAVLALACLKPQHVVLVPIVLLAGQRLAALGGFLMVALLQVALTLSVVDSTGTMRWISALSGNDFIDRVQAGQAWKMVSVPAFLHALAPLGVPGDAVTIVGLSVLLAATALLVLRVVRQPDAAIEGHFRVPRPERRDPAALLIAALSTTVVFSPHLVVYDAILLVPVALYLLEHRPSRAVRLSLVAAFSAMWLAPALHLVAGGLPWPLSALDAPWSALPLLVLWWTTLTLKLQREREPLSPAGRAGVDH